MSSSPPPSMSLHRTLSISSDVAVAVICAILLTLTIVLFILCRKKTAEATADVASSINLSIPFTDVDAATNGFHPSRTIGRGHLGTVYKAITSTGDAFAVKRIHPEFVLGNAGAAGAISRIRVLSRADHPNIVSILGYSEAPGERVIISELVEGMQSLDHFLCFHSTYNFGWRMRLRIVAGAARGLEYLHEKGIVHGRVRSMNLMVDGGLCGRVSDYGISFMGPTEEKGGGYWDGEGREECKAGDVYGFGVVLLEVLSGRRWERGAIVKWALPLIREGRVGEVLDERVGPPLDVQPLARVAKVASACVGNGRRSRPAMAQVAAILTDLDVQASM